MRQKLRIGGLEERSFFATRFDDQISCYFFFTSRVNIGRNLSNFHVGKGSNIIFIIAARVFIKVEKFESLLSPAATLVNLYLYKKLHIGRGKAAVCRLTASDDIVLLHVLRLSDKLHWGNYRLFIFFVYLFKSSYYGFIYTVCIHNAYIGINYIFFREIRKKEFSA